MKITTSQMSLTAGTLTDHLVKITVGNGDCPVINTVNGILRKYKRELFGGMETSTDVQTGTGWERTTLNFRQWPHDWSGTIRVDASVHLEKGMTLAQVIVIIHPHHPLYASLITGQ